MRVFTKVVSVTLNSTKEIELNDSSGVVLPSNLIEVHAILDGTEPGYYHVTASSLAFSDENPFDSPGSGAGAYGKSSPDSILIDSRPDLITKIQIENKLATGGGSKQFAINYGLDLHGQHWKGSMIKSLGS